MARKHEFETRPMTDLSLTDEELSGPKIDRRTAMKLFSAAGISAVAGCAGGSSPGDGGDSDGTDDTDDTDDTDNQDGTETASTASRAGGQITAGWNLGEIPNLDPPLNSTEGFEHASQPIFNSLLRANAKFEIEGEAAKDWTVNDGTEYVFTLREGMQFHQDYGEVTAQDVKYTIERGLNVEGSQVKQNFSALKPIDDGGVEVRDDYTIAFNLERPFAPMLVFLTGAGGGAQIMPQEAVEELGQEYQVKPVGSGPFEVAEHTVGSQIVLESFDDYWETDSEGTSLPYLDEVTIKPIPSASTLINSIRSGDVSLVNKIPFQNVDTLKQANNVTTYKGSPGGWEAVYFNLTKEPWNNKQLRRGIAKVLDREEYINAAFQGNHEKAVGPLPPLHGYAYRPPEEKPDDQKHDREEGERLIEESGAMGAEMKIMVWEAGVRRGRALSQQLSEYFDVKVNSYDYSTYLERLVAEPGSDTYQVTPWGSATHVTLDTTMYNFFKSQENGGVWNRFKYSNSDVDEWLEETRRTPDRERRAELYQQIEDQVLEDSPVVFTHHYNQWQAHSTDIAGYEPHPIRRDLHRIYQSE